MPFLIFHDSLYAGFVFFLETDYQGEYGDQRPGINQHLIYSEKVMILLFMEIESV